MPNASAKAEKTGVESLRALGKVLALRSGIASSLRRAFEAAAFIETETPVGIIAPAPEEYIEAPKAASFFLRTSPELQMKRLLAAGMERIYQLGPCFRAGENGRRHRQEFTMLEYYMVHADYLELLTFTKSFLASICADLHGSHRFRFAGETIDIDKLEIIPVREAPPRTRTAVRRRRRVSSSFWWTGWNPRCRRTAPAFSSTILCVSEPSRGRNPPTRRSSNAGSSTWAASNLPTHTGN